MNYDNEAIVRNAYHTAEGNVLDIPEKDVDRGIGRNGEHPCQRVMWR
jgi:hypothetical protein